MTAEIILTTKGISEKQKLFLLDRHKYVAYGGARGGGKSWAVRAKAILLALHWPGIKILIVRRTYPELQENHIQPLIEMLHCYDEDPERRIAKYNGQKKHLVFPNGSRILFRYCDTDRDADRFQGTEVDVLFVDEATHQNEAHIDRLKACVRGVNNFPKRIYYTCNPGGPGHSWIKRLFIDREYREGEHPEDYSFIQALVTDNPALMESDPDYIRRLQALPPKLRAAWLNGDWTILEGQFFEEFRETPDVRSALKHGIKATPEELRRERRWTHVIDPFAPPAHWKIYRSFDWGYNKPFSVGWWGVDTDGVVYRILEYYGWTGVANEGLKLDKYKVFEKVYEIERDHPWLKGRQIQGVADPAIWDGQYGESIAETAEKYHIYFEKGDHARIPGWMQMHYRMSFDENGFAMLYVFSTCKAFIRTIPLLEYDKNSPEDLDTSGEDHVADESRYFCMTRPIAPRVQIRKKDRNSDPALMALDLREEDLMPARKARRMEVIEDG